MDDEFLSLDKRSKYKENGNEEVFHKWDLLGSEAKKMMLFH